MTRVDVLPFHQMGRFEWSALGLNYALNNVQPPSNEAVEQACRVFRAAGSGVSIFTHDHEFKSPDKSLFGQGRSFSNTVIYPECFIGEGAFVFGNLNVRDILAPKTITRLKMAPPPCGSIGGVGSGYGVKRVLDAPASFPVDYLSETVENVRRFSAKHGAHLEKYAEVVREFLVTDRQHWAPYQARITALEAALFDAPADRAD